MGISIIIPAAQCDLNLSSSDKGMLQAAGFIGIVLLTDAHLFSVKIF